MTMDATTAAASIQTATQESVNLLNTQMQSNRQLTNAGVAAQSARMQDQMNSDAMAGLKTMAQTIGQSIAR